MDSDARAKLRARLSALRSRTTDRGCTEAEAIAAAEKAAEALSHAGLGHEGELTFEEGRVAIGPKTAAIHLWPGVAAFCHCRAWIQGHGKKWDQIYFGRWSDVEVALYLHEVLSRHLREADADFRKSAAYKRRRTDKTRRLARVAFLEGVVSALVVKLRELRWRRFPHVTDAAERHALIVSPLAAVDAEVERRKVAFSTKPISQPKSPGSQFDGARQAGAMAASGIDLYAPISRQGGGIAGLLT